MTMSTAAAVEEAGRAVNVPQRCRAINKDIMNALIKKLLKSAPPGTHGPHLRARVEQHLEKLLSTVKTPDHPPYALMIRQAITELNEEGGSNEEAIYEFIKLKYKDLPWAHANFLKHHLKKLKKEGEIFQVSGNCYKLSPEVDDSTDTVKKSKKSKRRRGKEEEDDRQRKVSNSDGFSEEKNFVAEEDQEQNGSRQESVLGLEVNEEVNEVHMEECERTEDASKEEALHQLKDAEGDKLSEQQKQEVTCVPRQETMLRVEVNEEVSQVHTREQEIVEDASREALQKLKDAEEEDQMLEQQNQSSEQWVQVEERNQCQELFVVKDQNQMQVISEVSEEPNQENEGPKSLLTEDQIDGKVSEGLIEAEKVTAVEQPEQQTELQGPSGVQAIEQQKQKQDLQPKVNRHHLHLQEIGAEVEWIEKVVTPQRMLNEVVRNGSEMCGKQSSREEEPCACATNLISSPAGPSLRQVGSTISDKEQCLELLNRTVKIQGMIVELLKSFGTAESSKSDFTMLESKESELSDEQLPHDSCAAETELPSSMDMEVAEQRENLEISNSKTPSQIEEPMLDNRCQSPGKHSTFSEQQEIVELSSVSIVLTNLEQPTEVVVAHEPREQIELGISTRSPQPDETMVENLFQEKPPQLSVQQDEVKLSTSSSVLNDLDVQGSSKLQTEVLKVNTIVEEEATTPLLVDLNSPPPSEQTVKNKEAKVVTAECHVENFSQQKLPEPQPDTILSIYCKEKEIAGPTVSAEYTFLSLLQTSQEQQQKPTGFVDGNQQLHQQKAEAPVQVLQPNLEQSFQQRVQFGSPSMNMVIIENDQQRLQPNLQGSKQPLGVAKTIISFAVSQSIEQQQKQMLSPGPGTRHFERGSGTKIHVPSISFNTGSLFSQPHLYQQPEPLSIEMSTSPMKPSALSGVKLQPFKPNEIEKLVQPQKQALVSPQTVINVEVREPPPSSYKRKLRIREDTCSSSLGPSPSSDKAVAVAVDESESQKKNEDPPQPKRKGRKPKPKPGEPGYTPPQSRPKILQSMKKKLPTTASADGEEAALSSQSPAKRPRGRPKKVAAAVEVEEEPIISKNP